MSWLGVRLDPAANAINADCVSSQDRKIEVRVIETDEEVTIARHTEAAVKTLAQIPSLRPGVLNG